jgi:thiol-disulfide isomerase/thioredoxin
MSETWQVVVILLAAVVLIEGVFLVAVMRQLGDLLLHGGPRAANVSSGPRVGAVVDIPGREQIERPALVVFTSSECEQCRALVPGLRRIHAVYGPGASAGHQLDLIAVLTDRTVNSRAEHARELGSFARTDLIALMQDWDVPGTPFAVALDVRRRVKGAEVVNTRMQLEVLAVEKLGILYVDPGEPERAEAALAIQPVAGDGSHSMEIRP